MIFLGPYLSGLFGRFYGVPSSATSDIRGPCNNTDYNNNNNNASSSSSNASDGPKTIPAVTALAAAAATTTTNTTNTEKPADQPQAPPVSITHERSLPPSRFLYGSTHSLPAITHTLASTFSSTIAPVGNFISARRCRRRSPNESSSVSSDSDENEYTQELVRHLLRRISRLEAANRVLRKASLDYSLKLQCSQQCIETLRDSFRRTEDEIYQQARIAIESADSYREMVDELKETNSNLEYLVQDLRLDLEEARRQVSLLSPSQSVLREELGAPNHDVSECSRRHAELMMDQHDSDDDDDTSAAGEKSDVDDLVIEFSSDQSPGTPYCSWGDHGAYSDSEDDSDNERGEEYNSDIVTDEGEDDDDENDDDENDDSQEEGIDQKEEEEEEVEARGELMRDAAAEDQPRDDSIVHPTSPYDDRPYSPSQQEEDENEVSAALDSSELQAFGVHLSHPQRQYVFSVPSSQDDHVDNRFPDSVPVDCSSMHSDSTLVYAAYDSTQHDCGFSLSQKDSLRIASENLGTVPINAFLEFLDRKRSGNHIEDVPFGFFDEGPDNSDSESSNRQVPFLQERLSNRDMCHETTDKMKSLTELRDDEIRTILALEPTLRVGCFVDTSASHLFQASLSHLDEGAILVVLDEDCNKYFVSHSTVLCAITESLYRAIARDLAHDSVASSIDKFAATLAMEFAEGAPQDTIARLVINAPTARPISGILSEVLCGEQAQLAFLQYLEALSMLDSSRLTHHLYLLVLLYQQSLIDDACIIRWWDAPNPLLDVIKQCHYLAAFPPSPDKVPSGHGHDTRDLRQRAEGFLSWLRSFNKSPGDSVVSRSSDRWYTLFCQYTAAPCAHDSSGSSNGNILTPVIGQSCDTIGHIIYFPFGRDEHRSSGTLSPTDGYISDTSSSIPTVLGSSSTSGCHYPVVETSPSLLSSARSSGHGSTAAAALSDSQHQQQQRSLWQATSVFSIDTRPPRAAIAGSDYYHQPPSLPKLAPRHHYIAAAATVATAPWLSHVGAVSVTNSPRTTKHVSFA